jgi:threonyl-tRNA synthetase
VLPIGADQVAAADGLVRAAIAVGLRAELAGPEHGSLGARIRAHRLVPYQAIIGADEAAADAVALRLRDGRKLPAMPASEALGRVSRQVGAHDAAL